MAKRYFPNENPIGKRLAMGGRKNPGQPDTSNPTARPLWQEIAGVGADTKDLGLSAETVPDLYVPYWQWPMQTPTILGRTAADTAAIAAAIGSEVKAGNNNLPEP